MEPVPCVAESEDSWKKYRGSETGFGEAVAQEMCPDVVQPWLSQGLTFLHFT